MKNLKLSLLTVFIGTSSMHSQINYEALDYAVVGTEYTLVNAASALSNDFVQTGENHFWDYQHITFIDKDMTIIIDPIDAGYKNLWCLRNSYFLNCDNKFIQNFNLAKGQLEDVEIGDIKITNLYQHLHKSSQELQLKMFGGKITFNGSTLPLILEYEEPDVLYKFPMRFGDSYIVPISIHSNLDDFNLPIQINVAGSRINKIDGWGKLKITDQTYDNVLRLRSELKQEVVATYDNESYNVDTDIITYEWFHKNYRIPILQVKGTEINGKFVPSSIKYIDQDHLGLTNAKYSDLYIYPNPTDGIINISIDPKTIANVKIFNSEGRYLKSNSSLDITDLPKGTYWLQLTTGGKVITKKVIRK